MQIHVAAIKSFRTGLRTRLSGLRSCFVVLARLNPGRARCQRTQRAVAELPPARRCPLPAHRLTRRAAHTRARLCTRCAIMPVAIELRRLPCARKLDRARGSWSLVLAVLALLKQVVRCGLVGRGLEGARKEKKVGTCRIETRTQLSFQIDFISLLLSLRKIVVNHCGIHSDFSSGSVMSWCLKNRSNARRINPRPVA